MIIEEHPNCQKCGLFRECQTPWMISSGSEAPQILVIGEAPGADEDTQGIPFVGRSGKLLRSALEELLGEDPNNIVRFTNVVRCRPPNNKTTAHMINYCKHYVLEEIEHYKPQLILLFGNSPLKAVLGETGITTWNGVVIKRDDVIYVPLFHPAYILRNPAAQDDWLNGMINAVDAMTHGVEKPEEFEFIQPMFAWELMDMRDELSEVEWIAYDTETTSLDAVKGSKIVAISISDGEKNYAFPAAHKDAHWTVGDRKILHRVIEDIFDDHAGKIIGHNLKFDLKHTLNHFGFDFQSGGDSMLASHLYDSRKGIHSLKRLAGFYLGMYDYDRELQDYIQDHERANPAKGGNYGNVPLEILLPYAAMDAQATYKLYWMLYEKLTDKQKDFYNEVLIPASDVLAYVEHSGFSIDQFIANRYTNIYEIRKQEVYEELLEDPQVPVTVDVLQGASDLKMMTDMYPYELESSNGYPPFDDFEFTEDRVKYDDGDKKRNRIRPVVKFNPNSANHLRTLYYDILRIPVDEYSTTPTGLASTGKDVLRPYKDQFPIIEKIRYYNLLSKVLSTYLIPSCGEWLGPDGRARSNFNLGGTVTGRLASSNPNFQNIPTPDKEPGTLLAWLPVKNIFTSSFPNGLILSADYSGMELRVYASIAECEIMLDIHKSGRDFHKMIASTITGTPYSGVSHEVRYMYKSVNFAMLYLGNEYTLNHKFGIPLDKARWAIDQYYKEIPSVLEYKNDCIEFATKHGYIESPFGRRKVLPYIADMSDRNKGRRNQDIRYAVNQPVQSASSDIVLCAMIILDGMMYDNRMDSKIVNTVHDSIVLDAPKHEVKAVAKLCVDVMENVVDYAKVYMPSIDFSWLKSPLKVDIDVGTHYGTKMSYDEWKEIVV